MPIDSALPERVIRVLVVDDSAYTRFILSKHLNTLPGLQVVGAAHNGEQALEMIPQLNPDVITLDVEMPHLNGLETLRAIMRRFPRPVIMLSSYTTEGASDTVRALMIGAVDFVAKPSSHTHISEVIQQVAAKIRLAAQAHLNVEPAELPKRRGRKPGGTQPLHRLLKAEKIIVIGSSTGGPRALSHIVSSLPSAVGAAFLIVQHMPVGFTRSLAERLNSLAPFPIKEAATGDYVQAGQGLLAPAGSHMVLDAQGRIVLSQADTLHGVRPAIDVTMASAVQHYGEAVIGVILTGMGIDGTRGAELIHKAGGQVLVEDASTCVVWGMPRSVVNAGVADVVVPLPEMPAAIQKAALRYKRTAKHRAETRVMEL